jgi:hypothetical protein
MAGLMDIMQPQTQADQSMQRLQAQETPRPERAQSLVQPTAPKIQNQFQQVKHTMYDGAKGGSNLAGAGVVDKYMAASPSFQSTPSNVGQPLQTKSASDVQKFNAHGYVDGIAGSATPLKAPVEQGHNFQAIPKQDGTFGGMINNRRAIKAAGGNPGYQQSLVPDYNKGYDRAHTSVVGDLVHDTTVGLGTKLANGAIGVGNLVGGLFGDKQAWRDTSKDVQLPQSDVPKAQEAIAKQQEWKKNTGPAGWPGSGQANMQAAITPNFESGMGAPNTQPQGTQPQGTQPQGTQPSLTGDERPAMDPYKPKTHAERLAPMVDATLLAKGNTPEGMQAHRALMNELAKLDAQSGFNQPNAQGPSGILYTDKNSMGQAVPGQQGKYNDRGLVDSTINRGGYSVNEAAKHEAGSPYYVQSQDSIDKGFTQSDGKGGHIQYGAGGLITPETKHAAAEAQMMKRWQSQIAGGKWGAEGAARDMAAYLGNKEQYRTQAETNRLNREDTNDYRRQQLKETQEYHQGLIGQRQDAADAKGKGKGDSAADRQNLETLKAFFPGKDEDRSDMLAAAEILDKSPMWAEEFAHNPNRVVTRIKKVMAITKAENERNTHIWGNGPQVGYGGIGGLNHEMPETVKDWDGLQKYYKDDEAGNY